MPMEELCKNPIKAHAVKMTFLVVVLAAAAALMGEVEGRKDSCYGSGRLRFKRSEGQIRHSHKIHFVREVRGSNSSIM
ncbi:hypothetical protein SDJN03_10316, partial [Cucurbita argyrosperma subsp. sororia]